jgi:hypothetical protein
VASILAIIVTMLKLPWDSMSAALEQGSRSTLPVSAVAG